MLIKEYRIPLPLSVSEYRIAQLYMIQKKSRKESEGEGSGVEILVNEPYSNEQPDGTIVNGQYTHKIYHIGKHLPSWFRSIVPQTAQRVEEEAWNAYPYTRTRYTCPFMEKFCIEIETRYFDDPGNQENVFHLTPSELKQRTVEYIDIVKDASSATEPSDENPAFFKSVKSGRGPLAKDWLSNYTKAWNEGKREGYHSIMCAYKLCRIDFRYWGMQSKVEKFITDIALRKTMVSAHQQAWCWQDEWIGLTMDDIRKLESETQRILALKMRSSDDDACEDQNCQSPPIHPPPPPTITKITNLAADDQVVVIAAAANQDDSFSSNVFPPIIGPQESQIFIKDDVANASSSLYPKTKSQNDLKRMSHQNISLINRGPSLLELLGDEQEEEDEFEPLDSSKLSQDDDALSMFFDAVDSPPEEILKQQSISSINPDDKTHGAENLHSFTPLPLPPDSVTSVPKFLFIVVHGGNFLDNKTEDFGKARMKLNDFNTFISTFKKTLLERYTEDVLKHFLFELLILPNTFSLILDMLIELRPNGYLKALQSCQITKNGLSKSSENDYDQNFQYAIPISALPLLAASPDLMGSDKYNRKILEPCWQKLCDIYAKYEADKPYVILICDMMGSLVTFDTLSAFVSETVTTKCNTALRGITKEPINGGGLESQVRSIVTLGSPLGLVLTQRLLKGLNLFDTSSSNSLSTTTNSNVLRIPKPFHFHNLFYDMDPYAFRIEPLLVSAFKYIPPLDIDNSLSATLLASQHQLTNRKGDTLVDCVESNLRLFRKYLQLDSGSSNATTVAPSFSADVSNSTEESSQKLLQLIEKQWWGDCRIDFVLKKCPPVFKATQCPLSILPHIFHASYWESRFVASFIIEHVLQVHGTCTDATRSAVNPGLKIGFGNVLNLYAKSPKNGELQRRMSRNASTNEGERESTLIAATHRNLTASPSPLHTFSHFYNNKGPDNILNNSQQIPGEDHQSGSRKFNRSSFTLKPKIRVNWNRTKSILIHSKNIMSNHRANDVFVNEIMSQKFNARFSYGPFDVLTIGDQKVRIYYQTDELLNLIYLYQSKSLQPQDHDPQQNSLFCSNLPFNLTGGGGDNDWKYLGEARTSSSGKISFRVPQERKLGSGIYKIKMKMIETSSTDETTEVLDNKSLDKTTSHSPKLAGSHESCCTAASCSCGSSSGDSLSSSYVIFGLAVTKPGMLKIVVFSVDGALYDSVSISGRDAKVKKGATEVVYHWLKAGYLVLYLSARPDFQMNNVISWMVSKGFPPSLIHFSDNNYTSSSEDYSPAATLNASSRAVVGTPVSAAAGDGGGVRATSLSADYHKSSASSNASSSARNSNSPTKSTTTLTNYPFLANTITGMKNKASYLRYLVDKVGVIIYAAYGSSKDISLYVTLNINSNRVYSLTKIPKKCVGKALCLEGGYVPHLEILRRDYPEIPNLPLENFELPKWQNRGSFKDNQRTNT